MLRNFALTVAPSKDPKIKTKKDIDQIVLWMKLKAPEMVVYHQVYEISRNGYLHLHAHILLSKNTYRKRISNYPGWSIRIKELNTFEDSVRWYDYLNKIVDHPIKQEMILFEHQCQNEYMFTQ